MGILLISAHEGGWQGIVPLEQERQPWNGTNNGSRSPGYLGKHDVIKIDKGTSTMYTANTFSKFLTPSNDWQVLQLSKCYNRGSQSFNGTCANQSKWIVRNSEIMICIECKVLKFVTILTQIYGSSKYASTKVGALVNACVDFPATHQCVTHVLFG